MPGLLRGIARTAVIAGTATSVSNRVSRRQAGRWAGQEQQAAPPAYPPAPAPAPAPAYAPPPVDPGSATDRRIEQLQKLGDLKTQGVLTEAEFQAQKQRILG